VALARAIAVQPRLLLFDEPLTALDAKLRDTLRIEIDGLLRQLGTTAVYVTHDQAEAMALGDRVVVMSHGRIAQIGSPQDIYHRPADRFVAEFVGVMNRLSGEVRDGWFHGPGGRIPVGENTLGGRCEALFRPERVRITEAADAHLQGMVIASYFLGDRTRLLVGGIGDGRIVVDTTEPIDLAAGDSVYLRIDYPIVSLAQ
jgi:putative spermidine/putrescine transport system ATP-binding protein